MNEPTNEEKLVEMMEVLTKTVETLTLAMEMMGKQLSVLQTRVRILERSTPHINVVSKN